MNEQDPNPSASPIVSLRGVSKTVRHNGAQVALLADIDLDLRPGEFRCQGVRLKKNGTKTQI